MPELHEFESQSPWQCNTGVAIYMLRRDSIQLFGRAASNLVFEETKEVNGLLSSHGRHSLTPILDSEYLNSCIIGQGLPNGILDTSYIRKSAVV